MRIALSSKMLVFDITLTLIVLLLKKVFISFAHFRAFLDSIGPLLDIIEAYLHSLETPGQTAPPVQVLRRTAREVAFP